MSNRKRNLRTKMISDNVKCHYCKVTLTISNFTFEHLQPKVLGGKFNTENIVGACFTCNSNNGAALGERLRLQKLEKELKFMDFQIAILRPIRRLVPTAYKHLLSHRAGIWGGALQVQTAVVNCLIKTKHYAGYKLT